MEIFHFETNKIMNLRPYLNVSLSNSKSSGTLDVGITDNQTTFFLRFDLSKSNEKKLNTKDDIFVYKVKWHPYFEGYQEIKDDKDYEFLFSIENRKIVFNEFLNFSKLCEYHKENKNKRVEILLKEREEREIKKQEYLQKIDKEKQEKEVIKKLPNKFSFISLLDRLDTYMSDYGNQEIDFGDYEGKNIDELTEDEAEYIFSINGGEVETTSALIEHEKLNEVAEYDEDDLTEKYKSLSQQDRNKVDKYLLDLIDEIEFND